MNACSYNRRDIRRASALRGANRANAWVSMATVAAVTLLVSMLFVG